jgi:hypothetical protein
MHFRDGAFAGTILSQQSATNFSIRRRSQFGDELATVAYSRRGAAAARTLSVWLFGAPAGLPDRLFGRAADALDFGRRPVVPSVKNAILVDRGDSEFCAVMKTAAHLLRIDADARIDPLILFGVGISAFLCKL